MYEVACGSAPGYVVETKTPPEAASCIILAHSAEQRRAASQGTVQPGRPPRVVEFGRQSRVQHPQAQRQAHMLDSAGHFAAHTGADCIDWAGHLIGPDHAVAGNMLAGPAVIEGDQQTLNPLAPRPIAFQYQEAVNRVKRATALAEREYQKDYQKDVLEAVKPTAKFYPLLWDTMLSGALILVAVVYGSVTTTGNAWALGDIGVGTMAWLNILGILLLQIPALKALKDYRAQKKQGLDPQFDPRELGIEGADFWVARAEGRVAQGTPTGAERD